MPVSYDRFVFMGISYGGGVVPILPRYDEAIDTIACFYPVLEYASLGLRGVQEETVDDFLGAIRR
ncbi:MAG TPA: hypothetical protein PK765_06505 [bacterium]|nr:hypothetical protein [bacterium]